jgi:protein PET100
MGWQLEIIKMITYVSFPVALFHYFNQPKNFEQWVIEEKKNFFPPESKKHNEKLKDFIREFNAKSETQRLEKMEMEEERSRKNVL